MKLTHQEAVLYERLPWGVECGFRRCGWLWRSVRGNVTWKFTMRLDRRTYPDDAEFVPVRVPNTAPIGVPRVA